MSDASRAHDRGPTGTGPATWIHCRKVIALLSEYLEGGLSAERTQALDAHMALCPPCVEFLESIRKTRAAVDRLKVREIPPEMHRRLHNFLRDNLRQGKRPARGARGGAGRRSRRT